MLSKFFPAPLLAALLTFASTAGAQSLSPLAQGAAAPEQAEAEAADGAGPARALLEALRDPAAREALLAELERIASNAAGAEGGDAAADAADAAPGDAPEDATPGGEDAAAAEQSQRPTVGRRLAELSTAAIDEAASEIGAFWRGLLATQRRLAALGDERGEALLEAGRQLLATLAVTFAVFWSLRFLARRAFRRMGGVAEDSGAIGRALVFVGAVVIDALVVALAWAVGNGAAWGAIGETGGQSLPQTLFLNAFLLVEMTKVAIRAVFAPSKGRLRLVPLDPRPARYLSRNLGAMTGTLGYGLLLLVPLVNATVSIFTGRSVQVLVYAVVLIWAMALVIRHRRAPRAYIGARVGEEGPDATFRILGVISRFWHWPVLAWLIALFIGAVEQSGRIEPMLAASARTIGVIALGVFASVLMARAASRGVTLPDGVKSSLPMLETRVNGFLLRFLSAARFVIFLATVGAALAASGAFDAPAWIARTFGVDFLGSLLSVAVVIVVAFALWLALASWVDFRLNPDNGQPVTARATTLLTLFRNAFTIALAVITLMISLSELGLDIGPLLASAGVLGLAIGFGAQKMVQDVITGVFIQLENAINVGDVVTVGGVTGVVEKLTIRSVSLRDLQGVFHIIPFSSVDMVSNFMKGFAFHVADLGIAYREDVEDGKRAMHAAFDEMKADPDFRPDVIGALEWFGVNELGDSAVVLRGRIRTLPGKQWGVGRRYNELLKKHCDAMGVEIPFPHMTVWFGEGKDGMAPPVHVAGPEPIPHEPAPGAGATTRSRLSAPSDEMPDSDEGER